MPALSNKTFFISDLHLSNSSPETIDLFSKFIDYAINQNIDNLYILGDFFNYWTGNDILNKKNITNNNWLSNIITALNKLKNNNTKIYFLPGNRDFLINKTTANILGFELISEDEKIINLNNHNLLILHGDTLCTKDKNYQRFRKLSRSKIIKFLYLLLPYTLRQKLAKNIRQKSQDYNKKYNKNNNNKNNPDIFDVVNSEVQNLFKKYNTNIMIHGHTHKPKIHQYNNNNNNRYVLGDWHPDGAYYLEAIYENNNNNELKLNLTRFIP